ncbi:40s ribosomal protein s5-1 [Hordeum vulgare]|nr:40s ribosomal protein s5-1 [Hordeum vulgare]
MEQKVFKCEGMVEGGLNANHMMITEFTSNHKMDAIDIGKHLSRLYDRVDQLQGQIYDLQNQNCEKAYGDANMEMFDIIHDRGEGRGVYGIEEVGEAKIQQHALLVGVE